MPDPFQNVDAAGEDFIKAFADSMDERQSDPTMEAIVASYLGKLAMGPDTLTVEVGAGAGAVTRRIADHAKAAKVLAFEPSLGFVNEAHRRLSDCPNVTFQQAPGEDLPLANGAVDHLIMHTVLTHVPDPTVLIAEARRVLRPGGLLVVCDADFSKATLSNFAHDPLHACTTEFVSHFVTDPFVVAKLGGLLAAAQFRVDHFDVKSRVVANNAQMLPWVEESTKVMVARGDIGQALADALVEEYHRRVAAGRLYGYQAFATAIAAKT
jgi:ubiquinone/menaquinone biosynthesis C-methylase UbiE